MRAARWNQSAWSMRRDDHRGLVTSSGRAVGAPSRAGCSPTRRPGRTGGAAARRGATRRPGTRPPGAARPARGGSGLRGSTGRNSMALRRRAGPRGPAPAPGRPRRASAPFSSDVRRERLGRRDLGHRRRRARSPASGAWNEAIIEQDGPRRAGSPARAGRRSSSRRGPAPPGRRWGASASPGSRK